MYRNIETRFWTDPKVRALPPEACLLFLYLITNPHTHVAGLYNLPEVLMAHETRLSPSDVSLALNTLSREHLAAYDPATEVVWVRNMLRYQGRGPKVAAAVAKQLKTLHRCPLIRSFLEAYRDWQIPYSGPVDTLSIPHFKGILSGSVLQEQEQEQDRTQDQEPGRAGTPSGDGVKDGVAEGVWAFYVALASEVDGRPWEPVDEGSRVSPIAARLKRFTPEEVRTAIRHYLAIRYLVERGYHRSQDISLFRSDGKLEEYLRLTEEEIERRNREPWDQDAEAFAILKREIAVRGSPA